MGSLPRETLGTDSLTAQHLKLLNEVLGGETRSTLSASASLVRSYSRSFNGFVAKLTQKEADKLASRKEVFSVFPRQTLHLHTTRSWDFLGLTKKVKRTPTVESNIIIGVLDTGADSTSKSFSDRGFGPVPAKWKGSCKGGSDFTCNKKLIGARNYLSSDSVSDTIGHGTHTASTAAGSAVDGASFYGVANGTARGGVPSARVAVYKVCDDSGCGTDAILGGFDDAIADGVDIISVSLGGSSAAPFAEDPVAIGAFHAEAKGVLVANSAGNSGPSPGSVSSVAPWILTVAANSMDRLFISKIALEDGTVLTGPTLNGFPSHRKSYDLVFGEKISSGSCDPKDARNCEPGCIDEDKVSGKILICNTTSGEIFPKIAHKVKGLILVPLYHDYSLAHAVPSVALEKSNFEKLVSYLRSSSNPRGRILRGEAGKNPFGPSVSFYSSRGPNAIIPDIMKPDISAPGTNILAAYPSELPPTEEEGDNRTSGFNVLSGTSMSCPHVAGAAAYVKTFHPEWSPSFIKSALMTTASKLQNGNSTGYEYSYGSGQISPSKAVSPGLVYGITKKDYLLLLCSLGVDISALDSNSTTACPKAGRKTMKGGDLNYPSLSFKAPASDSFRLTLKRTVTNVGTANSVYRASISSSTHLSIKVVPRVLSFKSVGENKSFTVEVSGSGLQAGAFLSNQIVWSDGTHLVRSPIIVFTS
ncbi:hypothetical protein SAY86_026616 [Trapa natans]|uniref:Uncharacterized protein n=1 Tax=Trapa natans TaxID=22666 RepID=A0AAN7QEQ0_TRANT|nr:hypothetical protein SAY86_026616 [Trapa natans]